MNPITLRQTFQTANLEAIREAQGFNDLQSREAARRKDVDDRTALEQNNVPGIPQAEALRTEERRGRERQGGQDRRKAGEAFEEDLEIEEEEQANPAPFRLDLLA